MNYVKMAFIMAAVCIITTKLGAEPNPGQKDKLAEVYSKLVSPDAQSTRQTRVFQGTDAQPARAKETPERQRLREAYNGQITIRQDVDCPCKACSCPPFVCKNNYCKENFVVIFSMSWCGPCKRLYPTIESLRKQNYRVLLYVVDRMDEPNLDAKFDVRAFPTVVVFDGGREVERAVGVVSKKWFTDRLEPITQEPYEGL